MDMEPINIGFFEEKLGVSFRIHFTLLLEPIENIEDKKPILNHNVNENLIVNIIKGTF